MNLYETVFICRQDVTPAQVENLAQEYTKVIRDRGGEVSKTEFCGLRNLAYRIKKNKKGHYVLMNITAPAEATQEVERLMKLSETVLRFLTVRVEKLDPNPSALMQQRGFREDRFRNFEEEQEEFSPVEGGE